MNLKMFSTLSVKSVAIALFAVHVIPILFLYYGENFLNQWLPSLFVVLLPIFFLLYRSASDMPDSTGVHVGVRAAFKIVAVAVLSVLTLFLIGHFALSFQPLLEKTDATAGWVVLPAAENMAYVLRVFLQAWLFALVCVMAGRWLKTVPHTSGFLSRFYPKRELFAWILDFMVMSSSIMLLTVVVVLAVQQLAYLSTRLLGMQDLFAFPQLGVFVFLFALFILNKATAFGKRMKQYSEKSTSRLAFIYLAFIGFITAVWLFTQMSFWGVPEYMQLELGQALNITIASLAGFARNWPLLVLSCSFYLVAPLCLSLSQLLASGSKSLLVVACLAPLVITAFFLSAFPSINAAFWVWVPQLNFSEIPLTDAIAQFRFSGLSILLFGVLVVLFSVMGPGSVFMKSLTTLTTNAMGHREQRVKENIAKFFRLICFMYALFGILGVYGLGLGVAIYLPMTITACLLLIGMGFYQRFVKRMPEAICMEVKNGRVL